MGSGVSRREVAAFYGAVGLVLGSLVALWWPGGFLPRQVATWVALLPLLAAGRLLAESVIRYKGGKKTLTGSEQ